MKMLTLIAALLMFGYGLATAQEPDFDDDGDGGFMGLNQGGPGGMGMGMGLGMGWHREGRGSGMMHGKGMMRMLKALDLSNDQIDKIKAIHQSCLKQNIPLKSQIELKQVELRELMGADNPDKDKIAGKAKEMESVKTQMHINRLNAHVDVLGVLTKDQRDRLDKDMFDGGGGQGGWRKGKIRQQ